MLNEDVPHHSSLMRIRDRLGEEVFKQFFSEIAALCEKHGLVRGRSAATLIEANASLDSLMLVVKAHHDLCNIRVMLPLIQITECLHNHKWEA